MASDDLSVQDLYHYTPSKAAAIVFAIAYGLSAICHDLQYRASRPQRYTIPLTLGAIFSFIGFITRALITLRIGPLRTLYTVSSMFILGAGPTYAGADYFIGGRLFGYVPTAAPMSPLRLTRTFVVFDALAEICVWVGSSQVASNRVGSTRWNAGIQLVRIAMAVQILLFVSFVLLMGIFHGRMQKLVATLQGDGGKRRHVRILYLLYASSVLIIVRSAYHIAESSLPTSSPFRTSEAPFLLLEGLMLLMNALLFNAFHPSRYLPADSRIYLSATGIEETNPDAGAFSDDRPLLQKVVDPLDVRGLFAKKNTGKAAGRERLTRDTELDIEDQ